MAPVVASDGKLFTLDGDSTVAAVSADSGDILWRTDIKPEGLARGGFGGGLSGPLLAQPVAPRDEVGEPDGIDLLGGDGEPVEQFAGSV